MLEGGPGAAADPDPPPVLVSFTADALSVTIPDSTVVRATADRSLSNTGYATYIIDDDGIAQPTICAGSTCGKNVYTAWSDNADPQPRHFHAEIRKTSTGEVVSQSGQITIEVEPFPWEVSLVADSSSVTIPNSTVVRATTNRSTSNTGYAVRIVDDDGQSTPTSCSGSSCAKNVYTSWSENTNPQARHYHAEVRNSTTGHVAAVSPSVTVQVEPFEWNVTLVPDVTSITVPGATAVRATANRSTTNTGYSIRILDEDGVASPVSCSGTTCARNVYAVWSDNPNPQVARYRAEIRESSTGHVAATAQTTVVRRRFRFDVDLTFSQTTTSSGAIEHKATAATSQHPSNTGYKIKLKRADGTELCATSTNASCTATVQVGGTYRGVVQHTGGHVAGETPAWTLAADGPIEESADGLDLAHLAALFPTSVAICNALAEYPGTHLLEPPSSLSDQYRACVTAANAGKTRTDVLRDISQAVGGAASLGALWYLQREGVRPSPPAGTPETPDDVKAPRPVPPPILPQVERLADTLTQQNDGLSQSAADEVAWQCEWMLARVGRRAEDDCSTLPIFSSGADVPEATNHDIEALAEWPAWVALNYRSASETPGARRWYETEAECQGPGACDEYPFWATVQGGPSAVPTPHLKLISPVDNTTQGGRYGNFVSVCHMTTGDAFLGIPLAPSLGIPTQYRICNGH